MADLRLILLGGFEATLPSGRRVPLPSKKAQALIAYCALRPGCHSRETLATLLWGNTDDDRARNSLRQTLFVLRTALPGTLSGVLRIDADSIGVDPAATDVDVPAFERLAAEETPHALERAAALYRGDLLEGFDVKEEAFEQWLIQERERLRDLAIEVLARLFRQQCADAGGEPAIRTARRLLALDPLQEIAHRALMRLLAQTGRREAALRQYEVCADLLRCELRLEPEPETEQLHQEILRGAVPALAPPLLPRESHGDAPRPKLLAPVPGWEQYRAQRIQAQNERERARRLMVQITEHQGVLQKIVTAHVRELATFRRLVLRRKQRLIRSRPSNGVSEATAP